MPDRADQLDRFDGRPRRPLRLERELGAEWHGHRLSRAGYQARRQGRHQGFEARTAPVLYAGRFVHAIETSASRMRARHAD